MGYCLNFFFAGLSPSTSDKRLTPYGGLEGVETVVQRQQHLFAEGDTTASCSSVKTVEQGSAPFAHLPQTFFFST